MRYTKLLPVFIISISLTGSPGCSSGEESQHTGDRPRRGDPAEMFQRIDVNQDGQLSWDEFKNIPARNRSVDEMFKRLDADSDGVISRDEFMSQRQERPDGGRGERSGR